MGIKIIVDSMCDVPQEYAQRYNIEIMPLTVHFADETYKDGLDITMDEFYKKLADYKDLPTTSQVTPIDFFNAFKAETSLGNDIITITGSSEMSGTYNSAILAKKHMDVDSIYVIDSRSITLGGGFLAIKAARLVEEGLKTEEIVKVIEESKNRIKQLFIVDTLKYLQKGGRISVAASVLGSILNVKPIITVIDGKLEMIEKARGHKKAVSLILDMLDQNNWNLNDKVIAINHTNSQEKADALEKILRKKYDIKEIIRGEVGGVVATHAGPGAIALYFEE